MTLTHAAAWQQHSSQPTTWHHCQVLGSLVRNRTGWQRHRLKHQCRHLQVHPLQHLLRHGQGLEYGQGREQQQLQQQKLTTTMPTGEVRLLISGLGACGWCRQVTDHTHQE